MQIAQPGQGPAHGWLAHAHLGGGMGDVAPAQQGVERGNQIEVQARDIQFTHENDHNHAFPRYQVVH